MKNLTLFALFLFSSILNAQTIELELFADGLSSPLGIENAGDDRLFVNEQDGKIIILNADGSENPTPFLDIDALISSGGERGLLGLAFHPDYANNGYFYVNYTNNSGDTVISRFNVDGTDPDIADPNSELNLMTIPQPFGNHNGGNITFGPDGYLYIGMGDGGSGGDPGNRAQNKLNLLGKMLRIDIDNPSSPENYGIPADNPYVGNPDGLDEIWAIGLRNPWRFTFDETTGDLWIGDVGQNSFEEINRVHSSEAGLNYGWRCYEGNAPFNTAGCAPMSEMTFPVADYPIPPCFCSVVGGYVYRGTMYTDIAGVYIFATTGNGDIQYLDGSDNIVNFGDYGGTWVSFGEDIHKELYIVDIAGNIQKVKGGVLSNPNFNTTNQLTLSPNPASENLEVSISNNKLISSISIIDLKGSIIYTEKNISLSEKLIPISNLSKGVYLVKIETENGQSIIKKLVVK